MLVEMRPGATRDSVEAVRRWASELGLDAALYDESEPMLLLITGDNAADYAEVASGLLDVSRVVRPADTGRPVTNNLRIRAIRPLVSPDVMMDQLPLPQEGAVAVHKARREISAILRHDDDRLIVVVGPCSIHDTDAAMEYAARLAELSRELEDDLRIVMRVYFEKPRTTVGWKGLINDPYLDNSFAVNDGLRIARQLLLDVVGLGLPAGTEFLDPITPQFITDSVAWGAIGARTTESQVHRNLTSGLSMPIGFKNGTSGDLQIAVDAMKAASFPHQFMSVTEQGVAGIVETRGNKDTHVILRGGQSGTNFDAASVGVTLAALEKGGLPPRVMIDASHGNSNKDYRRQPEVIASVAAQLSEGQRAIIGVMLESFLIDGRQELSNAGGLVRGQSVTDACMGWEMTVPVLRDLATAVRRRRTATAQLS